MAAAVTVVSIAVGGGIGIGNLYVTNFNGIWYDVNFKDNRRCKESCPLLVPLINDPQDSSKFQIYTVLSFNKWIVSFFFLVPRAPIEKPHF